MILMMFWLPIPGVIAAYTSHCAHYSNADQAQNADRIFSADHYLHNVDQKQIETDGYNASTQPCEINKLCHTSCGMLITAAYSTKIPISDSSVYESLNTNTPSFIPDLPQHPPRA